MKVEKRDLPCCGIRKSHVFELPFSSSFGFCGGDGASCLFRARRVAKGDRFGSELERCVYIADNDMENFIDENVLNTHLQLPPLGLERSCCRKHQFF